MPRKNLNHLEGCIFGRLIVIKEVERGKSGHVQWLCRCECGNETIVTSSNLLKGKVKSCGCLIREKSKETIKKIPKGWITYCKHCGKEFRAQSHKQIYCSVECSFLDRLKKQANGCIEWQGNINNQGYGVLRGNDKKIIQAHRYAWERVNGKIPDGMCICHKCDNRKCVNIEHLFLGTWYDNNHDRSLKGRTANSNAKLTIEQVKEIKRMKHTKSIKELCKIFNMSKSAIGAILNGTAWKNVNI